MRYVPKFVSRPKFVDTVKLVQNGHSKIDITKILMINGSSMTVKSIAECSFCNNFDLN